MNCAGIASTFAVPSAFNKPNAVAKSALASSSVYCLGAMYSNMASKSLKYVANSPVSGMYVPNLSLVSCIVFCTANRPSASSIRPVISTWLDRYTLNCAGMASTFGVPSAFNRPNAVAKSALASSRVYCSSIRYSGMASKSLKYVAISSVLGMYWPNAFLVACIVCCISSKPRLANVLPLLSVIPAKYESNAEGIAPTFGVPSAFNKPNSVAKSALAFSIVYCLLAKYVAPAASASACDTGLASGSVPTIPVAITSASDISVVSKPAACSINFASSTVVNISLTTRTKF